MTTNPNLSDLIKRNAALEKENAALRQFIEDFRQIANIPPSNLVVSTQHPKIIREMTAAIRDTYAKYAEAPAAEVESIAPKPDLSFTAHDDATSHGCQMCGNEHKSLNEQGYCSSCWTVWNS